MGQKTKDRSNEFKRRKREKIRLKLILLRDRRRAEKGRQFMRRELELGKRTRAQIVKEGKEIAERKALKKARKAAVA